ncbi:MAG: Coenzyme F420 hydrogenase/dehydrogenase, beta subunit C-terminal domain [Candidatus Krumholzibacteriota bacterium]|nr:Coenzyme F420 hydrogenase/dehydrogenase, beta subunit C-terminal domain [Candidatus Krumholzibacteriota bacterium]
MTSESRRWSRSSGGIASWVLSGLLKTRRVDRVVCVVQDDDPTRRFRFRVIEDPEDLWNASTSCYQQVEFSELLRNILYDEDQVRYAIIALPCVLKSLRLTMLKVPELSERVVFLAGLTCGQLKSRLFTDYLVRASGIDENQACDVSFREKIIKPDGMFHFTFSCKSRSSRKGKILLHHFRDYHYAWDMGYFKINACNYCDDLFAEVADVVFMDAWLPEYTCEEAGTNIVLVRNDAINEILRNGIENGEVNLDNIPVSKVISSQSGGLSNKGKELAARLTFADNKGWEIPIKRVIPSRRITIVKKFNILFSIYIMNRSKQAMVEQIQSQPGLKVFYYRMIGVQFMDRCLLIMSKLLRIFFRTRGREKSV